MADFFVKKGDRQPPIRAQLLDSSGTAIDLTGCSLVFRMRLKSATTLKVNASATVSDAINGRVEYEWGASDTNAVGTYLAEWEVTYADTTKQVVPSDGYLTVEVVDVLP